MIKQYNVLSTIICTLHCNGEKNQNISSAAESQISSPTSRYPSTSLFTLPTMWYLSRNRCQNDFSSIHSTMSVSTEKCTPGDRGKQLQVSHPGSTFALKTMKLSFIKIIIITINNNYNNQ